ncbi:uncharacterized protein B0I36DRAFT_348777 [Microdochium trichocladiopsis]|uniref:Uncharacterized protein n=1 Tax=Microdochium trichocladiopsis TaxID=1682393 RepID=A0A9P8Y7S3_9PEZI|nr:uncharacterized protein B0I36DRAFT_348777 [Microdochium trichocladiopsis]KAH7030561.1 hypothetical protein B0I36DRAFT_348777 [Microdochium trichocladiopsis]
MFSDFLLTIPRTIPRSAPIEGYAIAPMSWTGAVFPGGDNMTFHGEVEVILDEILKLNLNFTAPTQDYGKEGLARRDLEARHPTRLACDGGGPNGSQGRRTGANVAWAEAQRLRGLGGTACGGPGRSCVRMGCTSGTEIWLCNDNDQHYDDRCDWTGYLAELAISGCQRGVNMCNEVTCWTRWEVMGAQYDVRNYNVMITHGPDDNRC